PCPGAQIEQGLCAFDFSPRTQRIEQVFVDQRLGLGNRGEVDLAIPLEQLVGKQQQLRDGWLAERQPKLRKAVAQRFIHSQRPQEAPQACERPALPPRERVSHTFSTSTDTSGNLCSVPVTFQGRSTWNSPE